jgi:ATP:corrinoid adenosyltransferase
MAIMIPDTTRANASLAERRLFNRFRSELPDDCYVLHSLGLTNHKNKLWGECDFVVLSGLGIFVLEVKGGYVSCENGIWRFTRSDGVSDTKPEGPFEQAKNAMFAVRNAVEYSPELKGFLFGYGVIIPDDTFIQTGPEIQLGVLLDRRHIHNTLDTYLKQLMNFWSNEYSTKHDGRMMKFPAKGDLEKLRGILRPDVRTALTLNSSLCRVEQEQVELIEQQSRILQRMDTNPRTLICGGAGTGKTILALDTVARRAKKGQRTLYLCFNKLLGRHVREHIKSNYPSLPIEADNIHSWFHRIIQEAGLSNLLTRQSESDDEFFQHRYPSIYEEALIQLNYKPFDCLILDEAQDLLNHSYLDALDLTLKGGLSTGVWHIFLDPLQTIHSGVDKSVIDRLRNYGLAEFPLTVNCRNTRAVAVTASLISGLDLPLEDAVNGGMAETKFIVRDGNQHQLLEKQIDKLLKEGVNRDDIIILSKHPLWNTTLSGIKRLGKLRICDIAKETSTTRKSIDFCTIHAFKGLDRKIVIAWDLDHLDDEQNRLLHYCGLSRARSCLIAYIYETEKLAYERLAHEFGERLAKLSESNYA